MKKLFVFLAFGLIAQICFSQKVAFRSDTIIKAMNGNISMRVLVYDESDRVAKEYNYQRSNPFANWENNYELEYVYDRLGKGYFSSYVLDTNTGEKKWVKETRVTFDSLRNAVEVFYSTPGLGNNCKAVISYTHSGKQKSYKWYVERSKDNWVLSTNYEYEYGPNDEFLSSTEIGNLRKYSGRWARFKELRDLKTYTGSYTETILTQDMKDDFVVEKKVQKFDSLWRPIETLYYYFDESSKLLYPYRKSQTIFHPDSSYTTIDLMYQNGAWVNKSMSKYGGKDTIFNETYLWDGGIIQKWKGTEKVDKIGDSTITYAWKDYKFVPDRLEIVSLNKSGMPINSEEYIKAGNAPWIGQSKTEISYDGNLVEILRKNYCWDFRKNCWQDSSKIITKVDYTNKKLIVERYLKDSKDKWQICSRDERIYQQQALQTNKLETLFYKQQALQTVKHETFIVQSPKDLYPKSKEKNYLLGKRLFEEKKYNEAIEALTRAIKIDSLNASAYYYRGIAYNIVQLADLNPHAHADFEKAIMLSPFESFPEAYIFEGAYSSFYGGKAKCIKLLTNAIKNNPSDARFYTILAQQYASGFFREQPDYYTASTYFQKAYALNPKDVDLLRSMSQTYLRINDPNNALRFLKELIAITPNDQNALIILVQLHCSNGRLLEMNASLNQLNSLSDNQKYVIENNCTLKPVLK